MAAHSFNLPRASDSIPPTKSSSSVFSTARPPCCPATPMSFPISISTPMTLGTFRGRPLGEGNQWYFYSRKVDVRVTHNGYWNSLGRDEPVVSTATSEAVGMKKYFIFHVAHAPTNWIMHEYRLSDATVASSSDDTFSKRPRRSKRDYSKWVLCRVYETDEEKEDGAELSCLDEVFLTLDDLDEISLPHNPIQ